MEFPTVDEVVEQLRHAQKVAPSDPEGMEVRLQVYDNGAWVVRVGDAQYDTDHHGAWGAGTIGRDTCEAELRHVASQMLDQAQDMGDEP